MPARSLMARGLLRERDYYRFAAFGLGLPFEEKVEGEARSLFDVPDKEETERDMRLLRVSQTAAGSDQDPLYLAPDCSAYGELAAFLEAHPTLKARCRVTTPTAARHHVEAATGATRLSLAKFGLHNAMPIYSARRVFTAWQSVLLLVVLQLLAILAFASPSSVVLGLHLTASFFYLGCVFLRLGAAIFIQRHRKQSKGEASFLSPDHKPLLAPDEGPDTPLYSIMVALYKEARQVPDLVEALLALDWPHEKLEIKLICEADDSKTIAAVQRVVENLGTDIVHLVTVPLALPRTKPKALNYALPLCRGEFIVIYDAEDRPHPSQLREARARFLKEGDDLGCVQAPLVIHNHGEGWFPSQFAVEYSALFKGLLPALANAHLPLPLGGTSNHFRRKALVDTMGWDPFNVTEDADLGIRLARQGWRTGILVHATYEEAPMTLGIWLKQRTRWMKGWMQTVLVHLRQPLRLYKDLGLRGTAIFYFLMLGMVISALVHPLILGFLMAPLVRGDSDYLLHNPLFLYDLVTISMGYLAFAALAWQTLPSDKLAALRGQLVFLPFYWLLISIAAWRALLHLFIKPHEWEKTPHGLSASRTMKRRIHPPSPTTTKGAQIRG
ncbi:MAG: glycosyltransferase [Pseudomonadota bacterium]